MEKHNALRLLLDVPETEAIFGFDKYATILTEAIVGTDPHFTIGIFGKWGSGKTTLIKKLEATLKSGYPNKVIPVFFDAWRYQREEHMLLPLLDTLSERLKEEETSWHTLNDVIKRLTTSIFAAITLKAPVVEFKGDKVMERWKQQEEIKSDYFGWLSELQKALDGARSGDRDRRIVIIIDDLDRCLPHKVVEVLESIKVMLDVSGFIFVLALDERLVEQAIEGYYGENYRIDGREYMKKLVQVEFHLPPLRTLDVKNYAQILQQSIGPIDEAVSVALEQVVPMVAGYNPREVKRLINRVLLTMVVMRDVGITVPVKHQVAFRAMEFRWPEIVKLLAIDESIWNKLRQHIEVRADGGEVEGIKEILENNLGLDSYLGESPGKELLNLSIDEFSDLVYYSSITREKKKREYSEDVIDDVLFSLDTVEQKVILLESGILDGRPRSLKEISKELDINEDRIIHIQDRALRKLRHPSRSKHLRPLLSVIDELNDSHRNLLLAVFGPEWQKHRDNE